MRRSEGFGTVTRVAAVGGLAGLALLGVGTGAANAASTVPQPDPLAAIEQIEQGLATLSPVEGAQPLDAGGGPGGPGTVDPLRPLDGVTSRLDALMPGHDPSSGGSGTQEPGPDAGAGETGEDGGDDVGDTAPAGTPSSGEAAPAAAVDARVEGLLGACVRVPREGAPVQATLVVLDHDLITTLTEAGLPLQDLEDLVVPCPQAAAVPEDAVTPQAPSTPAPRGETTDRPASAVPSLPDRLAYTGADTVPLASLAVALLSVGALLGRGARRLRPCASRG